MGKYRIHEGSAGYQHNLSLGDALFPKTRQRVLGLLFGHPGHSFYASELIRRVGGGSGAVQRELARLADSGLVTVRRHGTQKHYQANPMSPVYDELCNIAQKILPVPYGGDGAATSVERKDDTLIIGGELSISLDALHTLAEHYGIRRITLFGSAARRELGPDSDIDLLVEFGKGDAPSLGGLAALTRAMSTLFGDRTVDVVTPAILQNPYRRRQIEKDMELLYAA